MGLSSGNDLFHLLTVETATIADIDALLAIENRAYPVPWNRQQMEDVFTQKTIRKKLLLEGELIGYAFVSIILDEGHLLHITVDPIHHGKRFGRYLLERVIELGDTHALATIFLEVRAGNTPARALYDRMGFNQIGMRKGYYPCNVHGREDAIVMAYTMPSETFCFKVD